jgi:glycosyl transferase, family 25
LERSVFYRLRIQLQNIATLNGHWRNLKKLELKDFCNESFAPVYTTCLARQTRTQVRGKWKHALILKGNISVALVDLKHKVTDFFDCILVINLPTRNDRRVEIEGELNKIGLSFADGSAELLSASRFTDAGGFDSVGARGCFDSHLRALKTAYEKKAKCVLILEDDCDLVDDIKDKLPNVLHRLAGTHWSIFYGGHLSKIAINDVHSGISKIKPDQSVCGAHFIAVSSKTLSTLIHYLENMRSREPGSSQGGPMHVDGAYSWFRKDHPEFDTWVAEPQLGIQRPSRTDIHHLKFYDRVIVLRQAIDVLRRLKRKFRI